MGFFRRSDTAGNRPASQPTPRRPVVHPLHVLGGISFSQMLMANRTIPPGYTFPNRFLNGIYSDWLDTLENIADEDDDTAMRASLDELSVALRNLAQVGAPLPVVLAIEESVTTNLAWMTRRMAAVAVSSHPQLCDIPGYAAWGGSNPSVDTCAEMIRNSASQLVMACSANPLFDDRPDLVVAFVIEQLQEFAKPLLETGSLETLETHRGQPNYMLNAVKRMASANSAVTAFEARHSNRRPE